MRIAIYGAGAIGAFLGAKLALVGEDVTLIARGPHLMAMQSHGIRIHSPIGDIQAHPSATDDPTTIGPVDFLFLTVKAHSLTAIAPQLAPLLGPETAVVSAQNGVPWWYFQRHGGQWDGTRLESVDPSGVISRAIEPSRIIGSVVYLSAEIIEPGVIKHTEGDRFSIGELDGSSSERCKQLSAALIGAGLKCPIRPRIRHELWVKLLGNMAFNPLSAITRATMVEIATHPDTSAIARAMMAEADSVARAMGVEIPISIDQRFSGAEKVGHHKTSMLQDLEAGRPLELESIVGAVVELGDKLGIPIPHTRTVYACVKLLTTHGVNPTSPNG
jgi:2-dehydropantoate 2-reductase